MAAEAWPPALRFVVEVPRGGFVKRDARGGIDLLSPLPCPFNYGSVPGQQGADGDGVDVVILGPALARGASGEAPLRGVVRFVDQGLPDDKWVCGPAPLRPAEAAALVAFFRAYGLAKAVAGRLRRRPGPTGFVCLEPAPGSRVQMAR